MNILEESSKVVKVFETKPNPVRADAKVTMPFKSSTLRVPF